MNYAELKYYDVANGPGVRTSLFVSGCTHHCKGCFNAVAWDFSYGKPFIEEIQTEIISSLKEEYVSGLTILGGEPLEIPNRKALLPFIKRVKDEVPDKTIWLFTGYLFDRDVMEWMRVEPETRELIELIDVIVDGEFVEEEKSLLLKFKGSKNQRTINVKESLKTGQTVILNGY